MLTARTELTEGVDVVEGATSYSMPFKIFRFGDLDRSRFLRARRVAILRISKATWFLQSPQLPGKSLAALPSFGTQPLAMASNNPFSGKIRTRQWRPSPSTLVPHATHEHNGQVDSSSDACSHSSQEQPHSSPGREKADTRSTGNTMGW